MNKLYFHMLIAAVMAMGLNGARLAAADDAKQSVAPTYVKTAPLTQRDFTQYLEINGTLEAKNKATVSARVGGTLEKVLADEGDQVKAGQVLFTIEDRTYQDAVSVAKATLAAAEAAVKVAEAGVEKSQAELHKATLDVERFQRLFEKKTASSNELEVFTLTFEKAKAGLSYSQSTLEAAKAQAAQASSALSISQKNLDDTVIKAPIDGRIAKRLHDPGEEIAPHQPVFIIVDNSLLKAAASLPAEFYPSIQENQTELKLTINGKDFPETFKVTYKSPVIEVGLRTFEMKALIKNDSADLLVPGALVKISIITGKAHGFAVQEGIPVLRTGGAILYTVENNTAKAISVQTGISEGGWVEVKSDELKDGLPIVVDGEYMIEDKTPVQVTN